MRRQRTRPPMGLAAMEVLLVLGAMFPVGFLIYRLLVAGIRLYHALIGNVVGSPPL